MLPAVFRLLLFERRENPIASRTYTSDGSKEREDQARLIAAESCGLLLLTMSEDDGTLLAQTVQQTQSSSLVPFADVESTGEVDGRFITYEGAITKDDDACLGFFSNAFRLPQGQVPFLKILVEDTLADEEDQTVYNDRKREAAAGQAPVSSGDGEDTALVQYYEKLNDGATPTAAGWLASMLSRWASKSDYLSGAGKDFVQRLVGALAEKRIPHAISLRPVKAIIKAVAFHPYLKRLAVARDDDTVCVYDLQRTMWLPLRLSHEFQKDIKCLEWQPMSGSRLAVGGSRGVCIWRLNGTYLLALECKYFFSNTFHFFYHFLIVPILRFQAQLTTPKAYAKRGCDCTQQMNTTTFCRYPGVQGVIFWLRLVLPRKMSWYGTYL